MDDTYNTDMYDQEEMKIDAIQSPADKLINELAQFTGTEKYYRSSVFTKNIYHTDGIQCLADNAKAFWLIDAIVSYQFENRVRREEFQEWTLSVDKSHAILLCTDGGIGENPPRELARQYIRYTDFPLEKITLYLEYGSLDGEHPCKILMLPSER
jgi:hypothetical protein